MANIRVTCPACKSELEIDAAFDGQEVECGNCLEVFKAKGPGSSGSSGSPRSSGGGKIPGARPESSSGSGRSRPAPRKKRRDDDDDDYEHDRRRDDDDDDDYAPPPPRRSRGSSGPGDGAATASLVLGIVSLVPGCCCGLISIPAGIAAIVTGIVGLKSQSNKGMAIGGIVLGALGLGVTGVSLFFWGLGNAGFNPRQFR